MGQLDKVFVPDPTDLVFLVVLILGEPELTLLTNDIEDLIRENQQLEILGRDTALTYLASDIDQVRISSLFARTINVELVDTGS